MGLLQRRSPNDGSLQPEASAHTAQAQARLRKGRLSSQKKNPSMPDDTLQKRKLFVNMFRSLRRDEVPPKMPVPSLPIGSAPVSILRAPEGPYALFNDSRASLATNGGPPGTPGGSTHRDLPGPGVCSSLPPPRPLFSHAPNHRQYGHSPSGSISSTMSEASASAARRPVLSISSPIPGIGDVPPLPLGYPGNQMTTTGPSPIQTTMLGGSDPRLSRQLPLLPSQQMPPPPVPFESSIGVAVSAPPSMNPRASASSESMPLSPIGAAGASAAGGAGSTSTRGSLASSRQRVQSQPHQQHSDRREDLAPLLPPLPSSQAQSKWRLSSSTASTAHTRTTPSPVLAMPPRPPKRNSNSEQDFIFDARVAAILSDPPLPPTTTPFTRIKPSAAASTTALAQAQRQPRSGLRTRADSDSPPHARPTSELRVLPPGALLSRGESLGVSSRPAHARAFVADAARPDSLLSTASWASAADGEAMARIRRRTSASGSLACSVSDSVSVFGESGSGGESSMDDSVEDLKTVEDAQTLPIRVRGNNQPLRDARNSLIPHTPHTPGLLVPPSSFMASMVSPGGMYSSPSSASSSTTDIHEGSSTRTPTASRTKLLLRTPSAAREIDTLRTRNSVLEVTNAQLEADLRKARSNGALQDGAAHGGPYAPPTGPAATSFSSMRASDSTGTTRPAKRDSALTIRADGTSGFAPAAGRPQHDLAVPALLSEIELLKRSGAALQAELQAVKSQVSLLFPPTPAEMAEAEALEGWAQHGQSSPGIAPVDRKPFRVSGTASTGTGTGSPAWADKYTRAPAAQFGALPPASRATVSAVAVPARYPRPMSSISSMSSVGGVVASGPPPPRPPRRASRLPLTSAVVAVGK